MTTGSPSDASYLAGAVTVLAGDSRERLREIPDNSVDAIVCDPPYGLGFMGKKWDTPGALVERKAATENKWDHVGGNHNPSNSADAARTARVEGKRFGEWCETWARECLRVLKPGGHIVAFSGTRTYHRLAVAIEDAGFEIRDQLAWTYGSGFPKSHSVSKALDKMAGAEREIVASKGSRPRLQPGNGVSGWATKGSPAGEYDGERVEVFDTAPATDAAKEWSGWGSALKPAWEPICLARKPLIGTIAENVLAHGTGALNIDATRIATETSRPLREHTGRSGNVYGAGLEGSKAVGTTDAGRWPANLCHDGSPEVMACFPESDGQQGDLRGTEPSRTGGPGTVAYGKFNDRRVHEARNDSGSAARFFFTSKADAHDRIGSKHPTVKPVDLMQWLCRLVCRRGGTILDPFAGTGTTGEAAWREGMKAILIEREAEYHADIARRMRLAERPDERKAVAKAKGKSQSIEALPLFAGEA